MTSLDNRLMELLKFGNEYLFEYIGFYPEESQVEIVPEYEWIQKYDNDSWGFYNPIDMTSKIRKLPDYKYMLTTAFHEYHGHGTYTENTSYGDKMRKAIRLLAGMEERLKESPMNETYQKNTNKAYDDFLKLQENARPTLEGFAVWTESRMCEFFGLEDVFKDKMKTMPNMYLREYINAENFVKINGVDGYLRQLGFRSKRLGNEGEA